MADFSPRTRHVLRAVGASAVGTFFGVAYFQGGASPGDAMFLGWQSGTATLGFLHGVTEDVDSAAIPLVVGGATGAEIGITESFPEVTGWGAAGYGAGLYARYRKGGSKAKK